MGPEMGRAGPTRDRPGRGPRHRTYTVEEPPQDPEKKTLTRRILTEGRSFFFDFLGAVMVLLIIIGALYTYTGNWPPLVVVQSGSMMHSPEESQVGVIDTGDLVFVKDIGERDEIIPYQEGIGRDHRTYNSYGDVIIFRPDGDSERTAIIHRAVLYIQYNEANNSYDIPSMGLVDQSSRVTIENYEWPTVKNITINIEAILANFRNKGVDPHSGFITKGDNNENVDQNSLFGPGAGYLEPVKKEWVLGKSVGEIPWFGNIKHTLEGKSDPPSNSVRNLIISIICIIMIPFIIEGAYHIYAKVRGSKEEEAPLEEDIRPMRNAPRRPSYGR